MAKVPSSHIERLSPEDFDTLSDMQRGYLLYSTLCNVHDKIVDVENEARDMADPSKLSDMFTEMMSKGF